MAAFPTTSTQQQPSRITGSSASVNAKQLLKGQPTNRSILPLGERHKVPGWAQSPSASSGSKTSVQVTVAGGQLTGSLSTVTIQAQQYLDGMWSISRLNNFLAQPKQVRLYNMEIAQSICTIYLQILMSDKNISVLFKNIPFYYLHTFLHFLKF